MGRFVLVSVAPGRDIASERSSGLAAAASHNGFTVSWLNAQTWLAVCGPTVPASVQVGAWTLIGDVFNRRAPDLPSCRPGDPWDYERKLMARFWGRYVGVRFTANGTLAALLRDPSGALDCVAWEDDGLTVACSSLEPWLVSAPLSGWRINVDRLGQAIRGQIAATGQLMIDGPTGVEAGTLQPFPLGPAAEPIWTPAGVAARSLGPAPQPDEAATLLHSSIQEAVDGLSGLPGPLAVEVSGGLDSSIVAACVARDGPQCIPLWLNAFGSTPESDERHYADLLGQSLGFPLTHAQHSTSALTPDWLEAMAGGFRPGLNALDYPQDLAWAGRLAAVGASAVMGGKGGDSILVQAATADVFSDLWRRWGLKALRWPGLGELAATNEVSLWTLIAHARRTPGPGFPLVHHHPLLNQSDLTPALHPWLKQCEDFGPAKRFQIAGVADSVSHHGPSALNRVVDTRHPLCMQPVVEACLALPTWTLALNGRDRGLARLAFADRIPRQILDRRSKGEMTKIYARLIVDNLEILRPWLIEGRLAAMGVIDPAAADVELTPEALIWRGHYGLILALAAYEGWTRSWERRLGPPAH